MNIFERMYQNMSAEELSHIILKGKGISSMSSLLEKDAGFCSGSSEHEDDHNSRDELHSPTDASEDSLEVKFTPILKNKRKSSEPSRVISDPDQGPLKKRFRYEESKMSKSELAVSDSLHRPWALNLASVPSESQPYSSPADLLTRHPGVTTLHRAVLNAAEQEQPLALLTKRAPSNDSNINARKYYERSKLSQQEKPRNQQIISYEDSIEHLLKKTQISKHETTSLTVVDEISHENTSKSTFIPQTSQISDTLINKPKSSQRNYKNMTRERRIEANARERTRVHTISAAYDTLRKAVPSYSSAQKLSKLSVLRIACSYILTLSRLAGEDFSIDQSEPPVGECVDAVTKTIQTEGKLRRKKDE